MAADGLDLYFTYARRRIPFGAMGSMGSESVVLTFFFGIGSTYLGNWWFSATTDVLVLSGSVLLTLLSPPVLTDVKTCAGGVGSSIYIHVHRSGGSSKDCFALLHCIPFVLLNLTEILGTPQAIGYERRRRHSTPRSAFLSCGTRVFSPVGAFSLC